MLLFPYFKCKLTKEQRLTNPPRVLCSKRQSRNLNQRVNSITLLTSMGFASPSLLQIPSLVLTFTTSHLPRFVLWLFALLLLLFLISKWFYIHIEVANMVQNLLGTLLPVSLMSISYIIIIQSPKPQFCHPPKYSPDNTEPFYNRNETPSDYPFIVAAPYLTSGNHRHVFRHFKNSQGTSLVLQFRILWLQCRGPLISETKTLRATVRPCVEEGRMEERSGRGREGGRKRKERENDRETELYSVWPSEAGFSHRPPNTRAIHHCMCQSSVTFYCCVVSHWVSL